MHVDGVHCRWYSSIGPVALKVVRVGGAAYSGNPIDKGFVRRSFPIATFGTGDMCDTDNVGGVISNICIAGCKLKTFKYT